jgi:IclR family pca regulon transcriptional regulator
VRHRDFVQSLGRGLEVIRAFGPGREQLTPSEVARQTGLTRAAARRFLLTLVSIGYLRTDGRAFCLTPRVLELGHAYLSGLALTEVARPHVEELVQRVRATSSVAVLDEDDVVYVLRSTTEDIVSVNIAVGTRLPAYATSMGRVLLAGIPPEELARYVAGARGCPTDRSRPGLRGTSHASGASQTPAGFRLAAVRRQDSPVGRGIPCAGRPG